MPGNDGKPPIIIPGGGPMPGGPGPIGGRNPGKDGKPEGPLMFELQPGQAPLSDAVYV